MEREGVKCHIEASVCMVWWAGSVSGRLLTRTMDRTDLSHSFSRVVSSPVAGALPGNLLEMQIIDCPTLDQLTWRLQGWKKPCFYKPFPVALMHAVLRSLVGGLGAV